MNKFAPALLAAALAFGLVTTSVAGDSTASVEALLIKSLETFTAQEEKGVPAEELSRTFYWPEALLTGEGAGKPARGLAEVAAMIKSAGNDLGPCHHAQFDPIVHSGRVASLILEYTCSPPGGAAPVKFSAIYVWEKRGREWKIIREVFVGGGLR